MVRNRRNAGFTLIELMIVVAIIAVIAAIAIPKLMSARISANENAAVATLRSIAAAQQQFQASSAIDTDADGGGEYAFFGELSGENADADLRRRRPGPGQPRRPGALPRSALPRDGLRSRGRGRGRPRCRRASGLLLQDLPARPDGRWCDPGQLAEAGTGGAVAADVAPGVWGSANSEIFWCAYAWPVDVDKTGNRAFMINQEGDLIQFDNRDATYEGLATPPTFDVAFDNTVVPLSMDQPLGLTVMGKAANDGNIWTQVGN